MSQPSIEELHRRVLYPVVRVKAPEAGGSGVLIYSDEDKESPGKFINIVLTCEHVVSKAITVKDDWEPVLKRQAKRDFLQEVSVELFDYDGSKVISANATTAEIIAYDKHHDLAALRLHNPRRQPCVANIVPEPNIDALRLFDPIWVSGCSLLHDPFASPGTLTYLREIIEQKTFLMCSASAIFGNSGGGLFHQDSLTLLGLVSRVTGIQVGFGIDIMTWMNFSTHPERLYEFIRHQELQFLIDPSDTYQEGMKRREKRKKEALREILLEAKVG